MSRIARLAILGALAAPLAACTDDGGDAPLGPAPPEGGQQLASTTYDLQPGEELYYCWTFYSPETEVAVTEVTSIAGPGVHHLALFQARSPEEEAPHECNVLAKTTWDPIWAGGTNAPGIVLPDGVGFKIMPHTQYVLQLHIQNVTEAALHERAGVNLRYDHAPDALQAAGLFALGSLGFTIPANATDHKLSVECEMNRDMNVFAAFPHMHKLGRAIELEYGEGGGALTSKYKLDPWPFNDQPMDPVTWRFQPKDKLRATCSWNNPNPTPVNFGESSDQEMCFFVVFYYPFTGLDGCIQ